MLFRSPGLQIQSGPNPKPRLGRVAAAILTSAAFLLASLGVDSYGTSRPAIQLPKTSSTSGVAMGSLMDMGPMPVIAPLFIQDNDFASTLNLVNDLSISTYADVILTGLNGKEITRRRVEFAPHSQRQLEISSLLLSAVSPATTGRIAVMQSPDLQHITMNSQLSITYSGAKEPNYIDEELAMPSAAGSQPYARSPTLSIDHLSSLSRAWLTRFNTL